MRQDKKFEWTDDLAIKYCNIFKFGSPENLQEFKASHSIDVGRDGWEIKSYYSTLGRNSPIIWKREDGLFEGSYITLSESELLKEPSTTIHSVLRVKDGLVFTHGERAVIPDYTFPLQITGFKIEGNKMIVQFHPAPEVELSAISKLPPERSKLFTTEDGVDIFEGDKYWYMTSISGNQSWKPFECSYAVKGEKWPLDWLTFSTRDRAIEYVKQNRPMNLSMKELASCITNYVQQTGGSVGWPTEKKSQAIMDIEKLEKLIEEKTKIKL